MKTREAIEQKIKELEEQLLNRYMTETQLSNMSGKIVILRWVLESDKREE